MLTEEVDDWWGNTRQRLEVAGNDITWVVLKGEFLERYFPKDVHGKKEFEFLELKQGNSTIVEYAAKFEELVKLYPHYNDAYAEVSKCINKARPANYKSLSEKRGKSLNSGKLYSVPADKGKQKISYGRRPSVGGASAPIKCYKCGGAGHRAKECKSDENKCFKCGKSGHLITDCKTNVPTCYNCGEPGHISTTCQKSKKVDTGGNVFTLTRSQPNSYDRLLTRSQPNSYDRLIRGTCYNHNSPFIAIIHTGATHSFSSANCARKLGLVFSTMNSALVIDIPTNGSMTTS
ncbi:uncharacterized protein LOC127122339 [Lathyrus oleraceus]|uniref:uncharacterized protein LOC127122339 n=1 Tax=Pisum sativum TaxID=3888 RepID=UPI0021D2ECF4|nr:uncharacterized protein LOC127122339 [Pisum sativum]